MLGNACWRFLQSIGDRIVHTEPVICKLQTPIMAEAVPLPVQRMGDAVPISPIGFESPDADNVVRRIRNVRCSLTPPPSLSMRRSAVASEDVDANDGKPENLRVNTSTTASPEESRDFLCICTPAPKIPRPRNAFILYRQHHQAQVTAQNPKLSNPEISKIIGLQWKSEKPEVKDIWKKLAEEEKQRHQRQYPEYRYQPRRGSKGLSSRSGPSPIDDHERCAKCNGRLMTTPQTPPTPIDTPIIRHAGSEIDSPASYRALEIRNARRQSIDIGATKRFPLAGAGSKTRSPDDFEPMSPDTKRRRANGAGHYHQANSILGAYGNRTPREAGRVFSEGTPLHSARQYVGSPLAEVSPLPRSWSGPMAPPPRPSPYSPWSEQRRPALASTYDESLRLPPLQSPVTPSPSRMAMNSPHAEMAAAGLGITISPETPARSLESVIMSLPFKRKLGLLARISRPVPAIVETGIRGAFIAVEGPDEGLLMEVGDAVEKGLAAMKDLCLKTWSADDEAHNPLSRKNGIGRNSVDDCFSSCFQAILKWQEKSSEIAAHLTSGDQGNDEEDRERTHGRSSPSKSSNKRSAPLSPVDELTPVALVKHGFSLTYSDRFSCRTPIADLYTPADHWQWAASLWRGTVCPDLIVYAKPSSTEDINKLGPVDFSKRMGMILVRALPGRALDEGMERRIAFEVMEWMREGSFRETLPKNWRME
ncbi:Repressor of filamentous growth 1 [Paramyrothecium foliicola]|nr:Repressor of filamentous growth 1 [Paramyrothecium foliicola]